MSIKKAFRPKFNNLGDLVGLHLREENIAVNDEFEKQVTFFSLINQILQENNNIDINLIR